MFVESHGLKANSCWIAAVLLTFGLFVICVKYTVSVSPAHTREMATRSNKEQNILVIRSRSNAPHTIRQPGNDRRRVGRNNSCAHIHTVSYDTQHLRGTRNSRTYYTRPANRSASIRAFILRALPACSGGVCTHSGTVATSSAVHT